MRLPQSDYGQWFILRERKHEGPFSYGDMIRMQQDKLLFDFDHVWTQGMKAWMPLAHMAEFSPGRLALLTNDEEIKPSFVNRRSPRIELEVPLFIHNDSFLWRGKTLTVSRHGAMILMENPGLLPRQVLNLHFRKHAHNPEDFVVIGEIIAKKMAHHKKATESCVRYGVKFIKLTGNAEKSLDAWVSEPANI
jgi:hypothetical protein